MIKNVVRYQDTNNWGVLCIDVWDSDGGNDIFYQRVVDELKNFNIGCIVNCTSSIKIDYSDPSVFNTFKKYQWSPLTSSAETNQKIMFNLLQSSGLKQSSNILKEQLFNKDTVHLSDVLTFRTHVDLFYPDVRHWIVIGNSWGESMHYGSLGFEKLLDIPTSAFHVFPQWGVQKSNKVAPTVDDLEDDTLVWADIPNDGYRLVTKIGGKWQR